MGNVEARVENIVGRSNEQKANGSPTLRKVRVRSTVASIPSFWTCLRPLHCDLTWEAMGRLAGM